MQDNLALLKRLKEGDDEVLAILTEENMGLVRHIAARFLNRGVEYDDLVQIGAIGLLRAFRAFSFDYGCAFSTYAVPLIIGEIKRFLRDDGIIKVGRATKQNGARIMSARETFLKLNGREPRISELSDITGIPREDIVFSMEAVAGVQSLSEPRSDDDEALTLESYISDESFTFDKITDKIALSEAIRKLPPLWREIITLRYFSDLSQNETGKRLGISQVKVSREEQKILGALKKALCCG